MNKEQRELRIYQQLVTDKFGYAGGDPAALFTSSNKCMAHGPLLATRMFDFVGVKIEMLANSSFGSPQRQIYNPRD